MKNDIFLEGAVARYRGFLHLIRKNREQALKRFCVPTYDVDLIWHSHQLHPVSYSKDLVKVLGKVLEHDDTDSDRTKGQKLDVGFSETTKQWEQTFGSRYWRAGSMYRGTVPSPLTTAPCTNIVTKKVISPQMHQNIIALPQSESVEVFLPSPLNLQLFFSPVLLHRFMKHLSFYHLFYRGGLGLFMNMTLSHDGMHMVRVGLVI